MQHFRTRISVALAVFGLLACSATARAGLEVHFAGTVTHFEAFNRVLDSPYTDTPQYTDVGLGSTFEGVAAWSYDPAYNAGHLGILGLPPVITLTVDHQYQFSSEMLPSILGRHGGFGVTAFAGTDPGTEDVTFAAGYGNLEVGIIGYLALKTASTLAAARPHGEVEWLLGQDLTHIVSSDFAFAFRDFNGRFFADSQGIGHALELQGTLTSLTVSNPEPSTLIGASVAGLVGVGCAVWWQRFGVCAK